MNYVEKLENEVSGWPGVSIHPHRFGGQEFRFGTAEIGHIHVGGTLDIPFTRAIRDALLAERLAQQHRWVPDSGWTTFNIRSEEDFRHALWLMRLSYLRYFLKTAADARTIFDQESKALQLSARFKTLLEPFMPSEAVQHV